MALSWGDRQMQQGREKQLERWTFDLPSSSTGRMWKEEERQRKSMCERQPMDRATPGRGGEGAPGLVEPPATSERGG